MKNQKAKEILRFFKFMLFSASAGLVEMGMFALLNELSGWSYWPCYLIALVASVVWNFTLNRKFTFKSAANVPVAMLKVAAFYAVFTPLSTWWTAALTGEACGWNEYLVLVLTMAVNFAAEYLYDRFVVFAGSIDSAAQK